MPERTCPVCGNTFTPVVPNQRYCPPTPEDRARLKGQAVSRCAKRAVNHRTRTRAGRDTRPLTAPLPAAFDCEQCGKAREPGKDGVSAHAMRFCGYDCKALWHRAKDRRNKRRTVRRRRATVALARAAKGRRGRGTWIEGPCSRCGHRFVSRASTRQRGYCSVRCKMQVAKRRYRQRYGHARHTSRARRFGVEYERVEPSTVFERDGYRCGICGQPTTPDAVVPEPRAPTLDHVVPMSKGGPHIYANVQCACFECSWRKGADAAPISRSVVV